MAYKINGLKHTESGVDELELLENSFETKEEAFQYIKDNLTLSVLSFDRDVVILDNGTEQYHYFEVISI